MTMTLFWSPRSPYARKALLVAHEAGLANRLELVKIDIPQKEPNPRLSAASPLRKLPTLVTEAGETVVDSPVICEYLDSLGNAGLFPQGADRWRAMALQAIADELMQILLLWRAERRRPEETRSQKLLADFAARLDRGLDWLDAHAGEWAGRFTIGEATAGVLLSYLDYRFPERPWRTERERLASWHETFEARPSAMATAFGTSGETA